MEILIEFILELLFDLVLGIVLEFGVHWIGWYIEDIRNLTPRKWLYPLAFAASGFSLGYIVSKFYPAHFLMEPGVAVFVIVVLPVALALILPLLKLLRTRKSLNSLEVDKFFNGYLLMLMFFLARVVFANFV